ncbi:hypothetical protein CALCODRAFT_502192 [Calocera cornea HHB12733]|uniref:Uncharacterized protein n=1 Tax=Calocera cornea HHB12733 TaxID=1353952 RepID=A0A165DC56_9BASI|nr:hypothetical protein CALCODRAFT_502192 [Calocera cornea HHB12733]
MCRCAMCGVRCAVAHACGRGVRQGPGGRTSWLGGGRTFLPLASPVRSLVPFPPDITRTEDGRVGLSSLGTVLPSPQLIPTTTPPTPPRMSHSGLSNPSSPATRPYSRAPTPSLRDSPRKVTTVPRTPPATV